MISNVFNFNDSQQKFKSDLPDFRMGILLRNLLGKSRARLTILGIKSARSLSPFNPSNSCLNIELKFKFLNLKTKIKINQTWLNK